jgi:uncharacterized protein YndB with AHSA1/START domain
VFAFGGHGFSRAPEEQQEECGRSPSAHCFTEIELQFAWKHAAVQETTMANSIITQDQDAVVTEVQIAAPPDRVFQALVDPKQVMSWWTSDECQIESFAMETKRGGRWSYDTKPGKLNVNGVSKFHCDGEVLEYDPPRLLSYTWIANWHDDKTTRTVVRWELAPKAGGTHVKVTHRGLATLPMARKDYSDGWVGVAEQLKNFVEKK